MNAHGLTNAEIEESVLLFKQLCLHLNSCLNQYLLLILEKLFNRPHQLLSVFEQQKLLRSTSLFVATCSDTVKDYAWAITEKSLHDSIQNKIPLSLKNLTQKQLGIQSSASWLFAHVLDANQKTNSKHMWIPFIFMSEKTRGERFPKCIHDTFQQEYQ